VQVFIIFEEKSTQVKNIYSQPEKTKSLEDGV
jgi:hypothetical protein